MILGLSVAAFTTLHVAISLVAIAAGLMVVALMIGNRRIDGWNAVFLATTILTSVTGFFFHSAAIGPPHIVGAISLLLLAAAVVALYARHLAGVWRPTYVATAVASLYLNCFVLVVQGFQKVPALNAFAPTGTEPPFLVAQALTLVVFIGVGWLAVRHFRPASIGAAPLAATA